MLLNPGLVKEEIPDTNPGSTMPTPPYFGRPLPNPSLEMIRIKDALYPKWTMEQFMTIKAKFGVIHNRATDIDKFGMAMHWKVDSRNVNQGTAYYIKEQDLFFLRSATEKAFVYSNGEFAKDTIWLEIERKLINPKLNKLAFSIGPPFFDASSKKIMPCEYHTKEYGISTFFSILDADLCSIPSLESSPKEDRWIFDISERNDRFLRFKVKLWCGTACTKMKFTNKRENMVFYATLFGEGNEETRIWTIVNSQQNPGRGAGVVGSKLAAHSKVINIDVPNFNGNTKENASIDNQVNNLAGLTRNSVRFTDYPDSNRFKIDVEIPRNFKLLLGDAQAKMELDCIQRDIAFLIHTRLKDAMKKKCVANDEILKNNTMMANANANLKQALMNTKGNLMVMCKENDRIASRLSEEMTARRNCPTCIEKTQKNKKDEDKIEEIIEVTDQ